MRCYALLMIAVAVLTASHPLQAQGSSPRPRHPYLEELQGYCQPDGKGCHTPAAMRTGAAGRSSVTNLWVHRGVHHQGDYPLAEPLPENTVSSFYEAMKYGVTAVELDVRLTGDGVSIVFHDQRVERAASLPGEPFSSSSLGWAVREHVRLRQDGGRKLASMTYEEVRSRSPTRQFNDLTTEIVAHEKITCLCEFLREVERIEDIHRDLRSPLIILDLQSLEAVEVAMAEVRSLGWQERIVFKISSNLLIEASAKNGSYDPYATLRAWGNDLWYVVQLREDESFSYECDGKVPLCVRWHDRDRKPVWEEPHRFVDNLHKRSGVGRRLLGFGLSAPHEQRTALEKNAAAAMRQIRDHLMYWKDIGFTMCEGGNPDFGFIARPPAAGNAPQHSLRPGECGLGNYAPENAYALHDADAYRRKQSFADECDFELNDVMPVLESGGTYALKSGFEWFEDAYCGPAANRIVSPALRVLPLGDASTDGFGSSTGGGYRHVLQRKLTSHQIVYDFVGSMGHPSEADAPQPHAREYDDEHEGREGWRIDEIGQIAACTTRKYQPNIVTLHVGSTDMHQNHQIGSAVLRTSALIGQVFAGVPETTVIVSTLLPVPDPVVTARILDYNRKLRGMVDQLQASGKHVLLADLTLVSLTDLTAEGHLNDGGYDAMAQALSSQVYEAIRRGWIVEWSALPDPTRCRNLEGRGEMLAGDSLPPGTALRSPSGRYRLVYQTDGNLVLYADTMPLWASGTYGRSVGRTSLQPSGNLVVYGPGDDVLWSSGTRAPGSRLIVQDDGNLVLYSASGAPIWASNTVQS